MLDNGSSYKTTKNGSQKFNAFFSALGPKREIVCVCFLDQRRAEEEAEEGRGNERRGFKGGRTRGEGCSTYVCTYTLVVHTTQGRRNWGVRGVS